MYGRDIRGNQGERRINKYDQGQYRYCVNFLKTKPVVYKLTKQTQMKLNPVYSYGVAEKQKVITT